MCIEDAVIRLQILEKMGVPEAQGIDLEIVDFAIELRDFCKERTLYPKGFCPN